MKGRCFFAFWPVFRRNWLVWRKLAVPSILGNIAEPLIWLIAFGYGLGALVGEIPIVLPGGDTRTVPYLLFLASGSVCMSAMNAASFEALYSAFSRMHVQKTWDGILNTPVSLEDIVLAEMLWAAFKALFSVSAIIAVIVLLGIASGDQLVLAWLALWLVSITFASIALIFTALAKGYDFFTYYFTLFLTPMTFLSGVFFPLTQLPEWLQQLAQFLPLAHAVALVRPFFLGVWPGDAWLHGAVLLGYAFCGFAVALVLTRRRFLA